MGWVGVGGLLGYIFHLPFGSWLTVLHFMFCVSALRTLWLRRLSSFVDFFGPSEHPFKNLHDIMQCLACSISVVSCPCPTAWKLLG